MRKNAWLTILALPFLMVLFAVWCLAPGIRKGEAQPETPMVDFHGDPLPTGAIGRLGTIRWRHGGTIQFAAFLPDGKRVVTVSKESIRIWEFPSGKEFRHITLPAAQEPYDRMDESATTVLSKDGKTIATYVVTEGVLLYDIATGKKIATVQGYRGHVWAVAFSHDGRLLATQLDYSVVVWDWAKHQQVQQFKIGEPAKLTYADRRIVFAPDGKHIATSHFNQTEPGNVDHTDGTINLWNIASGKIVRTILGSPEGPVSAVTFSADSKKIAFASPGKQVSFVEASTGAELAVTKLPRRPIIFDDALSKAYCLDSEQTGLEEWDAVAGKFLRRVDTAGRGFSYQDLLSLSPDGNTLMVTGPADDIPLFFDLSNGQIIRLADTASTPLLSANYTLDGTSILTVGHDGSIHNWDAVTGKHLGSLPSKEGADTLLSSPDGKLVADWRNAAPNLVTLMDATTGHEIGSIPASDAEKGKMWFGLYETHLPILFSPTGKVLAVHRLTQQKIELYQLPPEQFKLRHTLHVAPTARIDAFDNDQPHHAQTLIFSPDGKALAAYANSNTLGIWNTETGRRVFWVPISYKKMIKSGAFSADGRRLALDIGDGTVDLYEVATGKQCFTFGKKIPPDPELARLDNPPLPRFQLQAGSRLSFSPDGKLVAHAGFDRAVHVWDAWTGKELATFKGHLADLNSVAFAPDGKTMVSASDDVTALIWAITKLTRP